ncbi:hypothetical protein [Clostridium tertium]|uniref:Chaperone protein DnaJ n=1 Tax=Clostridium tertium TaxID=1559 RepID=A0A6N2Z3J9_9CLOT
MEDNNINSLSQCLGCNGTGKIKCDCNALEEPYKNCVTCKGEGNFICPICEGQGSF